MNPQLEALRSAWALARALGRVLVLPRLTCGMDRVWFPHDGVFPGSDPAFTIPFSPCPMDHVLDAEGMEKRGLLAQVREWSLLNNPQLPPATLAAAVLVDWLPPGSEAAAAAGPGPRGETLLVPGWDAAAVAAALAPLKGAPLLRFGSMPPNAAVFQPGSSAGAQFWPEGDRRRADFVEDMRIIGSQWCCIDEAKAKLRNQPYPPGQVWYDLMVGVVPHTDRFNRLWDGPWKIRLGP